MTGVNVESHRAEVRERMSKGERRARPTWYPLEASAREVKT